MIRVENVEIHLEVKRKDGFFRLWDVPVHNGGVSNDVSYVGGGGGTDQVVNLLSYVNMKILTSYG